MINEAAFLWLRRVLRRILLCKSTGIAIGAPPIVRCCPSPAPCFGAQDAPFHARAACTRYVPDRWTVSAYHEFERLGGGVEAPPDAAGQASAAAAMPASGGAASGLQQGLPPKMLRFMEPMLFLCFSAVFLLPLLPCCCSLLLTVRCCVAALYCCCVAAV